MCSLIEEQKKESKQVLPSLSFVSDRRLTQIKIQTKGPCLQGPRLDSWLETKYGSEAPMVSGYQESFAKALQEYFL